MKSRLIIMGVLCAALFACGHSKANEEPVENEYDITTYVTTADATQLFSQRSSYFTEGGNTSANRVLFTENPSAPTVDGFGLAITTASCYNLLRMPAQDRTKFLKSLFSPTEGVGSSLVRVSIGASDFCLKNEYTWCDTPGLEHFAVPGEDRTYLFPILKEIYAINPDVKIIGSPWSCPKWMKGGKYGYAGFDEAVLETDYDSWTSGRLKPSCYGDYAAYFVKWIQAMRAEGFDIHAITMQNEPLNHGNSMSMYMPWQDQRDFIKVLGPAMEEAGLADVKILLFDHNYNYDDKADQKGYPLKIYEDAQACRWAAGSAWHNYGGSVSELDIIRAAYPEKDIYFTEASIGTWNYQFASCLLNDFSSIFLGTLSRGGRGVTLWNLMLDEKNSPHSPHGGACSTCWGGVTIQSSDYRTVTRNTHWYNVAHASAVVRPGARAMSISNYKAPAGVELQMFRNTDGTIGVLICNKSSDSQTIVFAAADYTATIRVPAKSLVSAIWEDR